MNLYLHKLLPMTVSQPLPHVPSPHQYTSWRSVSTKWTHNLLCNTYITLSLSFGTGARRCIISISDHRQTTDRAQSKQRERVPGRHYLSSYLPYTHAGCRALIVCIICDCCASSEEVVEVVYRGGRCWISSLYYTHLDIIIAPVAGAGAFLPLPESLRRPEAQSRVISSTVQTCGSTRYQPIQCSRTSKRWSPYPSLIQRALIPKYKCPVISCTKKGLQLF